MGPYLGPMSAGEDAAEGCRLPSYLKLAFRKSCNSKHLNYMKDPIRKIVSRIFDSKIDLAQSNFETLQNLIFKF